MRNLIKLRIVVGFDHFHSFNILPEVLSTVLNLFAIQKVFC